MSSFITLPIYVYGAIGGIIERLSSFGGIPSSFSIRGENTRNQIEDTTVVEPGLIRIKGRTVPVHIHALRSMPSADTGTPEIRRRAPP
ncbi:MAG: hypothetical protein ISR48_11615 [Alphaproteobacteria bacterium]|nr:hypothetical protein [Alphaproteobacteria bacterium]